MDFSVQNSARRIVQDKPNWKSRQLDLGNRHRTTLNFGDLVPAYWQHVNPGDKLKMDATILAKFMPLIAPAFSRMKIRSEWFYVPLRQISPSTLRALQDFKPDDASTAFSQVLQRGQFTYSSDISDNQQLSEFRGFPSIPAWWIAAFNAADTVTHLGSVTSTNFDSSVGAAISIPRYRTVGGGVDNMGLEDLVTYASKFRCSKMMSYLGLPTRLTTLRYTDDVLANLRGDTILASIFKVDNFDSDSKALLNPYYVNQSFSHSLLESDENPGPNESFWKPDSNSQVGITGRTLPLIFTQVASASSVTTSRFGAPDGFNFYNPFLTTYDRSLISLLPAQAYQKIFNDFYRDEKLQPDEIRFFPSYLWNSSIQVFQEPVTEEYFSSDVFSDAFYAHVVTNPSYQQPIQRLFNNLFGLRRRNRAKDVLSSCVSDKVLVNRLSDSTTAPNVYQANLFSKIEKYLMKKEFTGSTWAEWLSNFYGVNSNDLLNNNVIFLGQKESVVSISENIQTSSSTDEFAQGNRAGLAQDFHNGDSIYFRVPDFGIVMCIVSVIPDEIDNFNGLTERFLRESPYRFNLPDLQNIGFAPVFNRRCNLGYDDLTAMERSEYSGGTSNSYSASDVFGYQPFGYDSTYTPNVISGDFQKSLLFWHQSPDLDTAFSGGVVLDLVTWSRQQPRLNFNLPSVGLRFQPYGSILKNQYYNNIFAQTNDESGDHIVADMRFFVTCHRKTAFFTDAIEDEK